jgi:acetylornithine/N-succinyldiaminopimelate aminotransferase
MEQAMKLGHISNLFYTEPCARLAKVLCQRAGMSNVFFGNSGAEGNEGLIKLARKYSFDKYGKGRGTVLTLKQSFHGRTLNTLAATGQEVFHNYFFPFPDGFRYAAPTMDGVSEVAGHDVCAACWSWSRGRAASTRWTRVLSTIWRCCAPAGLAAAHRRGPDGIGRTGTLFCYQQYGILPDAVSFAKGIAGACPWRLPGQRQVPDVLGPGTHGSTFGGNPVCAAAALAVLDVLDEDTISAATDKGRYIRIAIASMALPCLGATRGLGLMIGGRSRGTRPTRSWRQAHRKRPAGAHRRPRPALPAPADHHPGGDGQGTGDFGKDPERGVRNEEGFAQAAGPDRGGHHQDPQSGRPDEVQPEARPDPQLSPGQDSGHDL